MKVPFDVDLAATRKAKLVFDGNNLIAKATSENRDFTEQENTAYAAITKELEDLAKSSADFNNHRAFDFLRGTTTSDGRALRVIGSRAKSIGAQFVDNERGIGRWLAETNGHRPRVFTSPSVELMINAPVTEDELAPPYMIPGVVPGPMSPPTVKNLLPQAPIATNLATYSQETTATNNAAAVAEGAAKPESVLAFTKAEDAVRKIATWITVSSETLDDVPAFTGYLDARLRSFVDDKTDDQLLNGDGIDPNILGLSNRAGLAPPVAQTAPDTAADAIARQVGAIASTQFLMPDGIVMHPLDWLGLVLMKDGDGNYISGSPFQPFVQQQLWGLRVALSPHQTQGTALIGCFRLGALLLLNGALRVEASNAHQDYFTRNLVAVLAEQRAALAVLRPAAFGLVTGILFA